MPIISRLATIPRTALRTSTGITQRRTMASTMNWIVIVPDHPGMVAKRLEVRGQHLEGVKKHEASGLVKMGGEFLLS